MGLDEMALDDVVELDKEFLKGMVADSRRLRIALRRIADNNHLGGSMVQTGAETLVGEHECLVLEKIAQDALKESDEWVKATLKKSFEDLKDLLWWTRLTAS